MSFQERLRQARINKNLTQEQLASLIGVAKSTLNGYEKNNREPDFSKIKKLIRVLEVDANYLFEVDKSNQTIEKFAQQHGINDLSTLGSRIYAARKAKNLKQNDLAEIIDVGSGAVISNWEKDINKPDIEKLLKLCHALDVSLEYLLSYGIEDFSSKERTIIQKYRTIDARGKEIIDTLLEIEFRHVSGDNSDS